MIHGIGTDIVSIRRMDELHARFGGRLAERILAPEELEEYAGATDKNIFLAKRFAAKEAFAKAAGTGMRSPVHFGAVHVTHDALGRPGLAWNPGLSAWLASQGVSAAHLSLSDEREYAVAFVVLERS
ncbi:MAG: holo-ACP synthase [Thiobacillus sp.]|nr:holo-ACP synthase [Thiobacillus sp.]